MFYYREGDLAMKIAVIGGGVIGERHLDAIQEVSGLEATAIVDVNEARCKELAAAFEVAGYTDYEEMLCREQPDIAVIALPHYLHREASLRCLDAGCHLMLEKPMALSTQECDEIIAKAVAVGRTLMVGHTQHYHEHNRKTKAIVQSGELGRLVMIHDVRHVNYYRQDRPGWFFERTKSGGGILTNLGSHSVDKIQWLTDSRVTKVKGAVSYHGDRGDVEGSGLVYLETSIGVPATIAQSGYKGVSHNCTDLLFTKGMLRLETGKGLYISRGGGYEAIEAEKRAAPFVLQYEDLLRAIRTGEEPECSGVYSRGVVRVLECIYRSAETGVEVTVADS